MRVLPRTYAPFSVGNFLSLGEFLSGMIVRDAMHRPAAAANITIDHDRIHPENEFAKSVFPDERNAQGPCFSLQHGYNYSGANAAINRDDVNAPCSKLREIFYPQGCLVYSHRSLSLQSMGNAPAPVESTHRKVSMDFCDLSCKYASFPTSEAVDGSRSCRTFIALYCKKRRSLVHKNLPCRDKKSVQEKKGKRFQG
jgi:hypothetical protein